MYYKSNCIKAIWATSLVFLSLLALLLMVNMIAALDVSAKQDRIEAQPPSTYIVKPQTTAEDQNSAQESKAHAASSPFSKKLERGGPLLAELSAVYMGSTVGQPWGSNANEDRMDDLFGKGQWQNLQYENVEPAILAGIFSGKTNFVFLEGSQFTTEEMDSFVNEHTNLINNWVKQGGCLLINAAPDEGDGINFDQFDVRLNRAVSNEGSAVDETHPIFTQPDTPTQTTFNDALPLSAASLSGTNLSPIISDTTDQIILGEQKSGFGRVVFGGLTLPLFNQWTPQPEYTNLHKNIIHYAATCFKPVVMSEVELTGPPIGGINTSYTFTATVRPTNTTELITYQWQATGKQGVMRTDAGPVDSATFNWDSQDRKEITVTASTSSGQIFANHTIKIAANAPPEARDIMISPSEVINGLSVVETLGTEISVSYTYYDEDQDPEVEDETRIRWTRDDQITQQEQPALNDQRTIRGDLITIAQERWCATVEPYDGNSYGEPVETCVYIGTLPDNLLPQARNVEIPTHPSEEEPLQLSYQYSDGEGDSEDQNQTQLRWYRNNILQSGFNDKEEVSAEDTNVGEEWCAKVRVSDGTDFGRTVESNCGIISPDGNTLPVMSNPRIMPTMPTDGDELTVSYGYIDPDGDKEDQTQTIIRWLRDGQLQPQFNEQRSVNAQFTTAGEKWLAVIVPHDGQNYGRLDITPIVHISEDENNTPPEAINVQIHPAEPSNSQDLRLTYDFLDPDEGNFEENTIIRWYKSDSSVEEPQHMPTHDNLTVLPGTETSPSEVWYAVVIPYDGQDYGPDVSAHSVTIRNANSRPEARNVLLSPAIPGDDDNLELSYEYDDRNGDQEGATQIKWTINGREEPAILFQNLSIIPRTATIVGQEWCATVIPHDGTKPGEPVESNCVTIAKEGQNTPPLISEVYIDPPVPSSNDQLNLRYTYTDPDNDFEGNTQIHWYRNFKPFKSDYEDQTVIPASETSPGDRWSAVVQVLDRNGQSGVVTSTHFVIVNTAPQVLSAAIVPEEAVTSQDLIVSYEYSDKDNHPASAPQITWHKNGRVQPEFENQLMVPGEEISAGERWQATIYAFDGYEYSPKYRAAEIKVGARLYLPIILGQMRQTPTPTPIPNATNTPTPTPASTPTPSTTPTAAPFEPNNSSQEAYGPLLFGQFYEACPEDQDDWYYIILNETTSLEVILDDYAPAPNGQVVVYEEYFDTRNQLQRRVIASDGRELANMKIPNELDPNALKELSPGKYLIRVYTVANYSTDSLYQLKSDKR